MIRVIDTEVSKEFIIKAINIGNFTIYNTEYSYCSQELDKLEFYATNLTDIIKLINDSPLSPTDKLLRIEKALSFYTKKFKPLDILKYFKNWKINDKYDDIVMYTNAHSNGRWKTTLEIKNNTEYTFSDNMTLYLPKTIAEFISDILRYEDFDLIFTDEAAKLIFI